MVARTPNVSHNTKALLTRYSFCILLQLYDSRKYPSPTTERELEIPKGRGGGGSKTQEIPEWRGKGVECMIELVSRGIPEVL